MKNPTVAAGLFLVASFVASAQEVTRFRLVNADTDRPVAGFDPLKNGAVIDLESLPTRNLNIEAVVGKGKVGSVRFSYDGNENFKTESEAPFALAGDRNGDFGEWTPDAGKRSLSVIAFSGAKGQGTKGKVLSVEFTVVDGAKASVEDGPLPGADPSDSAVLNTPKEGVYGELKKWHRVTIAFEGPQTSENATPNPFTDYRLDVTFRHRASGRVLDVPGYYAGDGFAGETSAAEGNIWRVHFAPPETGEWEWSAVFRSGKNIAADLVRDTGMPAFLNGRAEGDAGGNFVVGPSDKRGRDNRARGMLEYAGKRYLRWAESGEYFLKEGADAPENLFAYEDFDGNFKQDGEKDKLIKKYKAHLGDWKKGDPTWQGGKGKGLIGAINYLASEGMNVFSFLTMNINGDDRNVFMYTDYKERLRLDVSRMDQWEVVMDHADKMGMYLHFKTQEAENDKLLDGGALGIERKLYYRELIARFGHHLALNWNLGEENHGQSDAQRIAMAKYFHDTDPYKHNIVIHTYPPQKNKIHTPLLGKKSELTGLSLQGSHPFYEDIHQDVLEWVRKSEQAGKPWVVACDEPGSAGEGLMNDAEDAKNPDGKGNFTDARHKALWGVLLAGGAGTEWYFGYKYEHSDLTLEDFRSRDRWWDYCRHALSFFSENGVPFHEMESRNELIGNKGNSNAAGYCFAKAGDIYVVYLRVGIERDLLIEKGGDYTVHWFDPRNGGKLQFGSLKKMTGGIGSSMGSPPSDPDKDWVVLVRRGE